MENKKHRRDGVQHPPMQPVVCFECGITSNLKDDPVYANTYWCDRHWKERHRIIQDFIEHAIYGT